MTRRLVVLSDSRAGRDAGGHRANPALVRYFHGLAERFDQVVVVMRDRPGGGARLLPGPARLRLLTAPDGAAAWLHLPRLLPAVRRAVRGAAVLVFPDEWTLTLALASPRADRLAVYLGKDRDEVGRDLRRRRLGALRAALLARLLRWALGRADLALYRGEGVGEWARRRVRRVERSRPITLLGGPPAAAAGPPPARGPVRLLIVGELARRKGIHVALATLAALERRCPGRHFEARFVGDGALAATLARSSRAVAVAPFTGDPEALAAHYRWAHLLLFPGLGPEGLPRVIDEALLFGLPVVAARVGGIGGELDGRGVVSLFPAGDAEAAADAVVELLADEELRRRRVRRGLARAAEVFAQPAWEQHADLLGAP